MAKNSCGGLSQAEIIAGLGIPKQTYYRYIEIDGYPLGADLRDQKAWVDEYRAKGDGQSKGRRGKGKGNGSSDEPHLPAEGTKEFYELEKLKFQALNERTKAQETVEAIVAHAESHLRRSIGKLLEELQETVQQEICPECSALLSAKWESTMEKLRKEVQA